MLRYRRLTLSEAKPNVYLMSDERFLTFSLNEKIRLSNLKRLMNGVRQPINRNDGHAFELGAA